MQLLLYREHSAVESH